MKGLLRYILLMVLFALASFAFAYADEIETIIILYEDGTIEERSVEEENQLFSFFL